jgi:hypothetical protein
MAVLMYMKMYALSTGRVSLIALASGDIQTYLVAIHSFHFGHSGFPIQSRRRDGKRAFMDRKLLNGFFVQTLIRSERNRSDLFRLPWVSSNMARSGASSSGLNITFLSTIWPGPVIPDVFHIKGYRFNTP